MVRRPPTEWGDKDQLLTAVKCAACVLGLRHHAALVGELRSHDSGWRISPNRSRGPREDDDASAITDSMVVSCSLSSGLIAGRAGPATPVHGPVHEVVDVDLVAVAADDASALPVGKLRLKLRGTRW
jgi:hypothetical protein